MSELQQQRMVDGVFRTRSLGVCAEGVPDQYADGIAARVWHLYTGHACDRRSVYERWLTERLRALGHQRILDVATGTGVDSVMLLENGFDVFSVDCSDKMLKYALKTRWERRHEPAFDKWVIEEANWLTLPEDLKTVSETVAVPVDGFDAIICLGNSFAHLLDFDGGQKLHRQAIANFHAVLKKGGTLIIDHRNYDYILSNGTAPPGKNIYYKGDNVVDVRCSNLYVSGQPYMTTLDYTIDATPLLPESARSRLHQEDQYRNARFRLSYYPHRLETFKLLLRGVFGDTAPHEVLGDFLPLSSQAPDFEPCYYIHVITRV